MLNRHFISADADSFFSAPGQEQSLPLCLIFSFVSFVFMSLLLLFADVFVYLLLVGYLITATDSSISALFLEVHNALRPNRWRSSKLFFDFTNSMKLDIKGPFLFFFFSWNHFIYLPILVKNRCDSGSEGSTRIWKRFRSMK